ncbi:hypothetical protein BC938DRAFT_483780 [Jimgerdemannia flammicorona]|uniref:Uncharacterized protein n=1 Tax=Jimgerdemannia flammicorona TaxID=994334 RepID=A0A433QB67_9FUNG|nr:hypothetical protein BC938DRAFT_483780 [Jimgerdemannia flammicorona]
MNKSENIRAFLHRTSGRRCAKSQTISPCRRGWLSLSSSVNASHTTVSLGRSRITSRIPIHPTVTISSRSVGRSIHVVLIPLRLRVHLGIGQVTAAALTTFFRLFCYLTPIAGAIIGTDQLSNRASPCRF